MPYQFLEDIATADVAFKAWGKTLEEVFIASADATMNVMVEHLHTIARIDRRVVVLEDASLEFLLFKFLQEFIYFKDADNLLLRVERMRVSSRDQLYSLTADLCGEKLDSQRHPMGVDVKAVTFHRFKVLQTQEGWEATVVLDI
ncbi:MAG: hypothetical protein A2Z81_06470 [Omnitrophica WOR_2 bacterium GWA2_45_18]|nr:MAG: hypothetical protein A2Z81_06470 [Omnitrophica WOR_2 bacterium GWA2_45_18]